MDQGVPKKPKKKSDGTSRRRRVYLKVQEIGSRAEQVHISLQNFVFKHIEESEREIHMKHLYLTVFSFFLLIFLGFYVSKKTQAETAMFYPSSCLGGWTNVENATGKPDADGGYTDGNSAILPSNTQTDLFCGGFNGDIPDNKDPKVLILRVAWSTEGKMVESEATTTVVGTNFASSSKEILEATTTPEFQLATTTATSTGPTATSTENKANDTSSSTPPPSTQTAPAVDTPEENLPISTSTPQSFFDFFKHFFLSAYAQETSDAASSSTPSSDQKSDTPSVTLSATSSNGAASLPAISSTSSIEEETIEATSDPSTVPVDTPPASTTTQESMKENPLVDPINTLGEASSSETLTDALVSATATPEKPPFFEIEYTFDGVTWNTLGGVALEDLQATQFEIPIPEHATWSDLSKLQIHIKRVENVDRAPMVFLDGIALEIEVQDAEGRVKETAIKDVLNTNQQFIGTSTNEDTPSLFVMSSSSYGVVLYDASGTLMYRTQAAQNQNYFPVEDLPYGNYTLVATNDPNWCANMTYDECKGASSTYVGEIHFTVARPVH